MFLEDGDWKSANEYCEKVLDIDPENASAYLGKLMSNLKVNKKESLKDQSRSFDGNNNYQKAIRFADDVLKNELSGYMLVVKKRYEEECSIREKAKEAKQAAEKRCAKLLEELTMAAAKNWDLEKQKQENQTKLRI